MTHKHELIDPSDRAVEQLNTLMEDPPVEEEHASSDELSNSPGPDSIETLEGTTIDVEDAREEAPVLEEDTERQKVRLLILTKDVTILQEGSVAHRRITDQRELFLEIHIVLLCTSQKGEQEPAIRLFDNIWVYPTYSSLWLLFSYDAYRVVEAQLVFGTGFHPDIIVTEDPFESGLVGYFLSKKYKRPLQIHIYEDFFDAEYVEMQDHPILYTWITGFVLRRVRSVRTKTEFQKQAIIHAHPKTATDVEVLPSYYNLDIWRGFTPILNLHEMYPRFNFIILHVSTMRASSHSSDVIAGAANILRRYPTIGLVIVGNGPLRAMLERQVISLGLQKQVEFQPAQNEVISHMKTAHILIHVSEDGGEDDVILESAVVKLPMIANGNGLAGKLFNDGESACLCDPSDSECIAKGINMYLNANQDRARFALNASEIVSERIVQDYGAYIVAYNQSIERCLVEVS